MTGKGGDGSKSRSRRKRLGSFRASEFSEPTTFGETPTSFQAALEKKNLEKTVPGLGEAILTRIDEMTDLAQSVMQKPPEVCLGDDDAAQTSPGDPELNTPSGFAFRILMLSGSIRWRVMSQEGPEGHEVLELIRDVLNLTAQVHALQMEFLEGPDIVAGRTQRDAGRRGGKGRASAQKRALFARNSAWQAEADRIWSEKPYLTKLAVADAIKRNLREQASVTSIRKTIVKGGRQGST